MLRRNVRLRREYLYRKSLEGKERLVYEKKRKIKQALEEGKPIPTELRNEDAALRKEIDLEDERTAVPKSTIDDEYANANERDPKILITTSHDPSAPLKQFAKELKFVFPNSQRMNRGGQVISEIVETCRAHDFTDLILVYEHRGLKNPLTLMSYVTPVMALFTALLSLIMDPWDEVKTSRYFDSSGHIISSCFLMLFGGTLAFFMVLTEYILVSVTSAVTVTIAGVVKEAVTILVAVFYFHDQFTWLKGAGLVTIMFGVSLFNWYKYQKLQKEKLGVGELPGSQNADAAKYVILEESDDEEISP